MANPESVPEPTFLHRESETISCAHYDQSKIQPARRNCNQRFGTNGAHSGDRTGVGLNGRLLLVGGTIVVGLCNCKPDSHQLCCNQSSATCLLHSDFLLVFQHH